MTIFSTTGCDQLQPPPEPAPVLGFHRNQDEEPVAAAPIPAPATIPQDPAVAVDPTPPPAPDAPPKSFKANPTRARAIPTMEKGLKGIRFQVEFEITENIGDVSNLKMTLVDNRNQGADFVPHFEGKYVRLDQFIPGAGLNGAPYRAVLQWRVDENAGWNRAGKHIDM
ncbi:MAG: hypothetical protein C0478_13595 [Planctomyces sp.]|nr:hypothetical protein [Planctomyces sp.]